MISPKRIVYKDIDGVECYSQDEFSSVEEFKEWCIKYGIKYETFSDPKLLED